jgi:hypothetical protein
MKQETLKEAAEIIFPHKPFVKVDITNKKRKAFIEGYKLAQQRMYSEEDMINFSIWVYLEIGQNTGKARTNKELFQEWLEQNKKGGNK